MNRSFRVIYNAALGAWVAVSEITKAKGKSSKSAVVLSAGLVLAGASFAGPTGGVVTGGAASINQQGGLTVINQATNRAIIDWKGFDVNKNETVQFNQLGVNSTILNRVMSANASMIDGAIKANGNVFIVNAAGIVVGKNANIQVGGLTLSSLGISNEDFMAGRDKFINKTGVNASVVNQGNIEAAQGGFVAMIGGQVSNSGVIIAKEGMVALASGNAVTLTIGNSATAHSIVVEEGTLDALIEAGGAIRAEGGLIVLSAKSVNGLLKNIINQTGILEASSLTRKGGKIILDGGSEGVVNVAGAIKADGQTGGQVVATGHDVLLTGQISATGKGDGGQVNIGGGYQGQDLEIAHATNVAMTKSASIDVSSSDSGKGGTAVLWSDGSTDFYGDIKAKGGANGGNGGLIETSGHNLGFNGTVDVSSAKGRAGDILLDPDIILITNGATAAQDASLPTITSISTNAKGTSSSVSVNAIEAITSGTVSLQANGYIQIQDLAANGGDGEINLKPNVSLVLSTINNGGSYTAVPGATTAGYGGINFVNNANGITATGTGAVTLTAGNSTNPGSAAVSANSQAINIGHVYTESGAIKLQGADGLDVKGNLRTTSGAITLDGDSDQGGVGYLNVTSSFKTDSGAVYLKGGNNSTSGVAIVGNVDVGTGSLTFAATSGTFSGTYSILGSVSALNNFTIAQPVTLGGTATIKTTGQLAFGGVVTVQPNSNLTLTATSYSIASAINGNGSSVTLKPANVTDDLQLGTGGTGTNVAPVLTKLNNFGNITIGGNDLQGKVTVSGVNNITGNLTVAAGGTGGTIEIQDGTAFTTNKDIIFNANKSITATGSSLLTSTGGKVSLVTPGDLTLNAGTLIKATTFAEIAVDGAFTNPAGLGVFDPSTPYWRVYVPNATSLTGTGFSASTGFHRYGCVYNAGCAAGTDVPTTGNGILFKDVPLLNINAVGGSLVYGTALTTFGTTIDYSGLINGDTIAMANVTGSAGNASFVGTPGTSAGGHVNVGSYGITASQGSLLSSMGYKFNPITNSASVDVTKKSVTTASSSANKVYDANTTANTTTTYTGLLAGDAVAGNTVSSVFSDKNAANGKTVTTNVNLTGADAANYQFDTSNSVAKVITTTADITKKDVNATLSASNKVYDANTTASASSVLTGVISGDATSTNTTGAVFSDKNAANGKTVSANVALTGADATNYNLVNATASTTANITQKNVMVVANASTKTYDGTTAATLSTSGLSGFIANDNINYSVSNLAFVDKNAGTAKSVTGTVTLSGSDAGNYSVGNSTGTGRINKRTLGGSVVADNKVYDGNTQGTLVSGSVTGLIAGDSASVNLAGSTATFSDKNVGNSKGVLVTVALAGADAGNYVYGNSANQIVTGANITPKSISANIIAADKTYDGTTDATLTGRSLTGVVAGDVSSVNLSVGAASFADKNAGTNKTVTANSIISGAEASNYTLSNPVTTTTANISKRVVDASASAATKTYDANTSAIVVGVGLINSVAGDDLVASANGVTFVDKNAGVNKALTGSVSLSGNDANNYTLGTFTGTGTINRKALSASLTAADKTYDGTTTASINGSFGAGVISGDSAMTNFVSGLFSDKNAGANKTVTTSFNITGADGANYYIGNTSNQYISTASIFQRAISSNITVGNKTYDGTTAATLTGGNLTGVLAGDVSTVNLNVGAANFSDKNAAANKTVTATSSISGANAANYRLTNATTTTTATINKKDVTSLIAANNKTYDGNTSATIASSNLSGVLTNDAPRVTLSVGAANFSDKNAATGKTVTASTSISGLEAGNYNLVNPTATTTADIGRQVLSANATINDKEYDGTTVAQWNSIRITGGRITGDSVNLDASSNIVAQFIDKNAGNNKAATVSVGLTGADAGNYYIGNTSNQIATTGNITPKTLTYTGTAANKVYNGNTAATITGGNLNGVIAADTSSVNVSVASANFSDKNAGIGKTVTINSSISGAGASNYTLAPTSTTTADITRKQVSPTLDAVSRTYDATTNAGLTGNLGTAAFVGGDDVYYSSITANFANKNVGTNKAVTASITFGGADAGNYFVGNLANQYSFTSTASINPRALSNNGFTASDKVYDANTVATASANALTGVIAGDNLTASVTANFSDKNAENGKTVSGVTILGGTDAANYAFIGGGNSSTTANITKKVITNNGITASDKVYDGNTTASVTAAGLTDLVANDNVQISVSNANFSDKNAGVGKTVTATTNLTGADAGNYAFNSATSSTTANINKKAVVASLSTVSKTYDGTDTANSTATSAGLIASDAVSIVATDAKYNDKNAGVGKTVTANVALSGNDATNYTITTAATGTGDITKKAISGNITAANKVYDATTAATVSGSTTGGVTGDDLSITAFNGSFSDKNAGAGKTVTANVALSGNDANNYTLNSGTATTTADIAKKALTNAGITASDKTYDATTVANATANTLTDVIATDVVTTTVAANFSDKNAGAGKTVTGVTTLGGADASNYLLDNNTSSTTASIAKKDVNNTGITASNKTYDGTTTANATSNTLNDIINGDFVSTSVAAQFGDKNAGAGKTVTGVTTLVGADANNYNLVNSTSTTTADIAKKVITNNGISAANKTYDGNTSATVVGAGLTDLIANDDVSITVTNANFSDKNAGINKTVSATTNLTGNDAGNYAFNSATSTTTANIDKKTIYVTGATANDKTYDATTNASANAGTLTGLVGTDVVNATVTSAQFLDKNAGVGKTVNITNAISGNDASNYVLDNNLSAATANIAQKVITNNGITSAGKTYDGNTQAAATANALTDIIGTDQVQTSVTANFADKNAGNGKVVTGVTTLNGTDAGNYKFANDTSTTNADIAKKVITNNGISAANKTYDGNTSATVVGAGLNDLVANDDVQISISNANFSDKNAGAGKTVTATTNLTGNDAGNYVFNSATSTTTANIDKKTVSVNGTTAANKVYDATTNATATVGTVSGLVGTDTVTASVTDAQFVDKNAGVGKTVNVTTALAGADVGNYQIDNASSTTTANIDKKVIYNNGIVATNKTYDGTTAANATANTLSDIINGDFVSTSVAAQFGDKNAGNAKAVTGVITLNGTDAGNYALSNNTSTSTANIDKKAVSATGSSVVTKTYDGNTTAQIVGTSLANTVANDSIGVNATGTYDNKNAGVGKDVAVGYALTGADANNYALTSDTLNTKGDIDKKTLTYTISGNGQTSYTPGVSTAPVGYTGTINNPVAGDNVGVTGLTFVSNGTPVNTIGLGTYGIGIIVGGRDAGNYTVDYNSPSVQVNGSTATTSATNRAVLESGQQISYVPVYANGRSVDSKARVVTSYTPEEDEADSLKGSRSYATGTRADEEFRSNFKFRDPAKIKNVDDELKRD